MGKSSDKTMQDGDALVQQNADRALESEGQKYRIYGFLKKNPGLLAGVGSALVLVLSAMVNFCSYAYEAAMLQYWNVDLVYMNISLPSRVNGTIATLLFVFAFVACILILDMLTRNIRPLRMKAAYLHGLKKSIKRDTRRVRREMLKSRFLRKSCNADIGAKFNAKENQISNISKEIRLNKKHVDHQMRKSIILLWFLLFMSIYIWVSLGDISLNRNVLITICSSAVVSIIVFVPLCRQNYLSRSEKRREREKACEDYINDSIQEDIPQFNSPRKKILSGQFEIRFSDKAFIRMIERTATILVFYLFALVIIFQCFGYMKAVDQKQFMIVTENSIEYAVIHNNGETAVLAEIREQGNNCVIDRNCQQVVSAEGLVFEIREYTKVGYDPAQ